MDAVVEQDLVEFRTTFVLLVCVAKIPITAKCHWHLGSQSNKSPDLVDVNISRFPYNSVWHNLIYSVMIAQLTHCGRVMHKCVRKLAIIGSDNGLSPDRRQAIIWTNAGILLTGPLGTNVSEILIEILTFLFKKMPLNTSSAKWRPFCLGLNVLNPKPSQIALSRRYIRENDIISTNTRKTMKLNINNDTKFSSKHIWAALEYHGETCCARTTVRGGHACWRKFRAPNFQCPKHLNLDYFPDPDAKSTTSLIDQEVDAS